VRGGTYRPIKRRWSAGDTVELSFDMTTRLLKANPSVNEDRGRVAFQRGPVVFCMEGLDQANGENRNLVGYTARLEGESNAHYEPDLLGGVVVLEHSGAVARVTTDTGLYYAVDGDEKVNESPAKLRLIPYYAWSNRTPSPMQVWVPFRFS
jgi:hypothetical protein